VKLQLAENKERSTPKARIESLSDLIFGLALSIGALTLIGQAPSNFQNLLLALLYYGFSFLILIRVWYSYTQIMGDVRVETRAAVFSNVAMLFLVSIEPFLFNEMLSNRLPTSSVSIIYALDLAGLFGIQTLFTVSILHNKELTPHKARHYQLMRNVLVVSTTVFLISALPVFWTLTVQPTSQITIPLRFLLWVVPLLLIPVRRVFEKKT
jgi:uncharacterized membrane protein